MYIFFKFLLALLSFSSLVLLIFISFLIAKYIFFTDPIIGNEIFNYEKICGLDNATSLTNKKCENLMTIYWLFVVGFGLFIILLLTIYPFFKIKKIKNKLAK